MRLKEKIKQFKHSENIFLKTAFYTLKPFWMAVKLSTDARLRAEFLAKIKSNKYHYQVSTFTKEDRYPFLFRYCAQYLQQFVAPKILSFGCSTGEEVRTLGRYLPNAFIIGIDINKWCIKQCNKNNRKTNFFFYHRLSKEFKTLDSLDAVFCMAVFQRTENRTNKNNTTASGFNFELFEKELILLDSKLKVGGLLIIDHADFSFMDTVIAERYMPSEFEQNLLLRNRPLFNRDNIKISDVTFMCRVFVKQR